MSWRDTTPQPVQDDLDELLAIGLDQAAQLLKQHGDLLPFALRKDAEGVSVVMADLTDLTDDDPIPNSTEQMDAVVSALLEDRSRLLAAATVATVNLEDGREAVWLQLEHRDGGPAIAVLRVYDVPTPGATPRYGALHTQGADRRIWPVQPAR